MVRPAYSRSSPMAMNERRPSLRATNDSSETGHGCPPLLILLARASSGAARVWRFRYYLPLAPQSGAMDQRRSSAASRSDRRRAVVDLPARASSSGAPGFRIPHPPAAEPRKSKPIQNAGLDPAVETAEQAVVRRGSSMPPWRGRDGRGSRRPLRDRHRPVQGRSTIRYGHLRSATALIIAVVEPAPAGDPGPRLRWPAWAATNSRCMLADFASMPRPVRGHGRTEFMMPMRDAVRSSATCQIFDQPCR